MFHWLTKLLRKSAIKNQTKLDGNSSVELVYELPFDPGARFFVLQGYGGAYSHTDESYYSIDFQMPEGTPVCASRGGIVYRVINHFTSGGTHHSFKSKANSIYILHPDDSIAAYVHLMHRGSCVIGGDAVKAGQIIGYSGNTGWSDKPHLHFHVADAILHEHVPTKFNTAECGKTTLDVDRWYTRPASQFGAKEKRAARIGARNCPDIDRDPFAFSPELLQLAEAVANDLEFAGYDRMSYYSSIDAMHDVHGLEVCGIRSADDALQITRILLRRFSGWNAGWIHAHDSSSAQGWVARIQRDLESMDECWDTD